MDIGVCLSETRARISNFLGRRIRTTILDDDQMPAVVTGLMLRYDEASGMIRLTKAVVNDQPLLDYVFYVDDVVEDAVVTEKLLVPLEKYRQMESNANSIKVAASFTTATEAPPNSSESFADEVASFTPTSSSVHTQDDVDEGSDNSEFLEFLEKDKMTVEEWNQRNRDYVKNPHASKKSMNPEEMIAHFRVANGLREEMNGLDSEDTDDSGLNASPKDAGSEEDESDRIRREELEESIPKLPSPEFDVDVVLLSSVNQEFETALDVISRQHVIGLDVFMKERSRNHPIEVIAISTDQPKNIFVFRLEDETRAEIGLRVKTCLEEALKSNRYFKIVVFKSTEVSDVLRHRLYFRPNSLQVEDVQLLDIYVMDRDNQMKHGKSSKHKFKPSPGRDLEDIVVHRLKEKRGNEYVETLNEITNPKYYLNYLREDEYRSLLRPSLTVSSNNFIKRRLMFLIPLFDRLMYMSVYGYRNRLENTVVDKSLLTEAEFKERELVEALGSDLRLAPRGGDELIKSRTEIVARQIIAACQPCLVPAAPVAAATTSQVDRPPPTTSTRVPKRPPFAPRLAARKQGTELVSTSSVAMTDADARVKEPLFFSAVHV